MVSEQRKAKHNTYAIKGDANYFGRKVKKWVEGLI